MTTSTVSVLCGCNWRYRQQFNSSTDPSWCYLDIDEWFSIENRVRVSGDNVTMTLFLLKSNKKHQSSIVYLYYYFLFYTMKANMITILTDILTLDDKKYKEINSVIIHENLIND